MRPFWRLKGFAFEDLRNAPAQEINSGLDVLLKALAETS